MLQGGYGYILDAGIGVGWVDPATPEVRPDPTEQVAPCGPSTALDLSGAGNGMGLGPGDPIRWHSAWLYERMYNTPAVGSSFNALRAAALSGGVGLLPAIKRGADSGPGRPGQVSGSAVEADLAAEIADSNRRLLDSWETPADLVLWEMMEAMYLGHVMAEVVAEEVVGGPDDGLLAIRSLLPLRRDRYRFLVDRSGRVGRVGALTVAGDWKQFDPAHFAWLTWDPYRGDPRGRSCFRMAVEPWERLVDLWPEVVKGWKQFGTPWVFATVGPGDVSPIPARDPSGSPIPGKTVTPTQALAATLVQLRNGKTAAASNGSTLQVVESTKDATVVSGAITILEAQVVKAILLQVRATMEAKHGSKADSETGQDVMGTLVRFVRKWLERFVRSALVRQNAWNYGEDIARRLTPLVTLGDHEHQDFAANASGVGLLFQSKYFTESQLPFVDTFLGLPQRQAGDLRIGPDGESADAPATADPAADPNAADPNAQAADPATPGPNAAPAGVAP